MKVPKSLRSAGQRRVRLHPHLWPGGLRGPLLPHLSQAAACRPLGPGSGPCPAVPLPALRRPAAWGSRPSRPPAVEALLLPGPGTPRRRPACSRPGASPDALHAPAASRSHGAASCGPWAASEASDGRHRARGLRAGAAGRRAVSPSGAVPLFLRRQDPAALLACGMPETHSAPHGQTAPPVTPKMEITANFRVQEAY